ncbi:tRNA (cytosine(34)-C(5))-methyltransferase [Biomphalaria glabrata]|nr:tRNA (cytosine(34)-C(5))-methyltransferase-like; partial [Biomphalaria glabrata]
MGKRKGGKDKHYYKREKKFNRGSKVGEAYDLGKRDNELFAKFYKGQGFVPEDEWNNFYETLKTTLPVTFRITGYKSQSEELLKNIKGKFFSNLLDVKVDGEALPPPKQLPWYPNELGWQLDLSRKVVRSSEQCSKLHDFLVAETECGSISRQEAVSMIPPLVLDVQSHHKVLDMCAAPGSKTAQLIEYLHSTAPAGELPTGYVIANDTDNKRCYLMVHQVKRLQSPCCVIVNHDGTFFPKIRTNSDESNPEYQLFDRILCDVPCSGDGTMRKNFDVWNKWHPLQGANLHGLQCKILRRGCQLLAVGGRIVYSTCSLNPEEDEAVIAEMLRTSEGAMELVDVKDMLPGLKFTKGVSTWKVMTRAGEWIESAAEIPAPMQTQFKHTIFPPKPEEVETFHLDRCMRILPHHQDTGGFFVAVLQKVKHLPGSKEAKSEATATQTSEDQNQAEESKKESTENQNEIATEEQQANSETNNVREKRKGPASGEEPRPPKKPKKLHGYKEDPFLFMEETDPAWKPIQSFFGLTESCAVNQILFRSMQGKRSLYFVSKAVRELTRFNEDRIRFINMGVKAFSRSPSPLVPECDFRITQECLGTLLNNITKRKVYISKQDAIIVISQENPFIGKLSEESQAQLHAMTPGSCVFLFTPSEKEPSPNCEVCFCGWRGKNSVRCFGSRSERAHALMLLGEDLKEINKKVEAERKAKQLAQEAQGDVDKELKEDTDSMPVDDNDEVKESQQMEDENGEQIDFVESDKVDGADEVESTV